MESEVKLAICIPWRDSGCEYRRNALKSVLWNLNRYNRYVFLGDAPTDQWNLSEARNDAAEQAMDKGYDVLAFLDADTLVCPNDLYVAGELAYESGQMVKPFSRVTYLSEQATKLIFDHQNETDRDYEYDGVPFPKEYSLVKEAWNSPELNGQSWVVPAGLHQDIRGFDPNFQGWGGEDNAYDRACSLATGLEFPQTIPGHLASLYHPSSRHTNDHNQTLWQRYQTFTWDEYLQYRYEET